jgi:hypothetical protein
MSNTTIGKMKLNFKQLKATFLHQQVHYYKDHPQYNGNRQRYY